MVKPRLSPHFCLANNIRYLILALLIACCSVLFSNITLYSVAVLYDDFQGTQLWRETNWPQHLSAAKRRFIRNAIEDDSLNSSVILGHLTDALNEVDFNEAVGPHGEDGVSGNSSSSVGNIFIGAITKEETTTIRLLSSVGDGSQPSLDSFSEHRSPEQPTYKSGLHPDKDIEGQISKWNDISQDKDGEKLKEHVEIAGISHETLEERILHFLIWTAPGIGMLCGAFPAAWFLRSFGGRQFFTLAMIVSAIATALLATVPHIKYGRYLTACLRIIQGLAFASVFPMIGSVTASWGTLKQQFSFLVCCTFFVQVAPLVSWPASATLFAQGCTTPFLIHAAVTVLLALIWMITFREKPQYHSLVNGLELNKIVAGKIKAENNRILTENPWQLLIKSFPVWAIWIAAFGYFLVISVAVHFLPLYCFLIVHDTRVDSALLAALPFLFMFFTMLLDGLWHRLAKLCNERTSVLAFNTTSFIICALIFIFLAIFPPGGAFTYSLVTPFTLILCSLAFSLHGFLRSATLVGRFFGQFIVSYMQVSVGFAFFITAAAATFFVEENTSDEWRIIFLVLAALVLISAAVFGVFGSAAPEEWSKDSWDPSAARPMITFDQIDYHADECGVLEMRILR